MRTFRHGTAITPNDTTAVKFKGIYVGTTGNLTVLFTGDTVATTLNNVPVGVYQFEISKVLATGTTATNLVGLS